MEWDANPKLYAPYLQGRVRRGLGIGVGEAYNPWLKVRDVPSRGTSSILQGIRIPRSFQLLSKLETTYFYISERNPAIIDIREQFPLLDVDETLKICADLGVRHKYKQGFPEPLTLDFLLTEKIGTEIRYRAASIKTPGDAADPAVRRRLAVENRWCINRGITWAVVDTSRFTDTVLRDLLFIRGWFRHRLIPNERTAQRFAERFLDEYQRNVPLAELISSTSKKLRVKSTRGEDIFRYCAWRNMIAVSLEHPISLDRPLVMRHAQPAC